MSDTNRGLDLSRNDDQLTQDEKRNFRQFYVEHMGRAHPGLEFYLFNTPATMKRYRYFAETATPRNIERDRRAGVFGFVAYYALTGYAAGVRYEVFLAQHRRGMTRSQVMEALGVVFMHAGPRGSETIANALDDYEWIEPNEPAEFPDGWAADPAAFSSGLDFSNNELSTAEVDLLNAWYLRWMGEIPRYVPFMAKYNPVMLKAYRNRLEHLLVELPKQVLPTSMLHFSVNIAHGPGIRENLLLARGFGVSRDYALRVLFAPTINSGVETISLVDEVAGDILEHWDDWRSTGQ